eukprot:CAMPEP_0206426440 /NCGR_PEP_ID=MMETSP0324_2-20121206/4376_1 /ASSEMBLY_ACC=CAM_ASM_000836 /TAXON_ID=2866 /ORGANISM="Crypthecodinium cohnii, Strain Seligo" /LENGTH=65 /DNA_ID=CAMNT_0053891389 /DNA_START=336 /DNA_END=529 /DNA_ORIENTATION=+
MTGSMPQLGGRVAVSTYKRKQASMQHTPTRAGVRFVAQKNGETGEMGGVSLMAVEACAMAADGGG